MPDHLTPHKVRHLSLADLQPVDWYERMDELEPGQVFRCKDGTIVELDRRVPGDGTKWYVLDCEGARRFCYDTTIEPGDLLERLSG